MISKSVSQKERMNSFDLLRVISAIAVIIIHANFHFFEHRYPTPNLSVQYIVENLLNIVTRFSVPCFVMMSGGFNLKDNRNGEYKYFYRKTFWKIVLPALFAAMFFLIFDEIVAVITGGSLVQPFIGLIRGFYALWFLYMLIGLYIITPLLIKLKKAVSQKEYISIGVILLLWGGVSQVVSDYKLPYTIGTIGAFLGYYIIGDILLNIVKSKHKSLTYIVYAIIFACITWCIRYLGFDFYTYVTYRNFFSPTICAISICIFLAFKELKISKDFSSLSGLTFFVYIFHTWVMNIIFVVIDHFDVHIDELALIPIVVIITCIISSVISFLYKLFWNHQKKLKGLVFEWKIWK